MSTRLRGGWLTSTGTLGVLICTLPSFGQGRPGQQPVRADWGAPIASSPRPSGTRPQHSHRTAPATDFSTTTGPALGRPTPVTPRAESPPGTSPRVPEPHGASPPPPEPTQESIPEFSYVAPPPPPPPPPSPPGGIPPIFDPGPNGWGPFEPTSMQPGLFFGVDFALLYPAVKDRVQATVMFADGRVGVFRLPKADLDETISPRFELGYRLPDTCGFFAVNYRFLSTDGRARVGIMGGMDLQSRLDLNVFDFDYGTAPLQFAPRWDVTTRVGLRVANVFFDSTVENDFYRAQVGNNFFGAGPHAQFEVQRHIVVIPGLALFGSLDGGVIIGQIRQHFREEIQVGSSTLDTDYLLRQTQSVPVLALQAGVSYRMPGANNVQLRAGYQFERYFDVGRLDDTVPGAIADSQGEVTAQGAFMRLQIDF